MREHDGVFKDKGKYICIVSTDTSEGNRSFYVGKFDNEDEALNAYSRVSHDSSIVYASRGDVNDSEAAVV